jgi:hypothetical protein
MSAICDNKHRGWWVSTEKNIACNFITLFPWRWRQYLLPKHWLPTRLFCIASQAWESEFLVTWKKSHCLYHEIKMINHNSLWLLSSRAGDHEEQSAGTWRLQVRWEFTELRMSRYLLINGKVEGRTFLNSWLTLHGYTASHSTRQHSSHSASSTKPNTNITIWVKDQQIHRSFNVLVLNILLHVTEF